MSGLELPRISDVELRARLAGRRMRRVPESVAVRVREILEGLASGAVSLDALEGCLRADASRPLGSVERGMAVPIEVPREEMEAARRVVPPAVLSALGTVRQRLREYAAPGVPRPYVVEDQYGNRLTMEVRPLRRVGVYAPGGRAVYPSSVLMTAVPARLAGVAEVILTTPAQADGHIDPVVLAAAAVADVDRVFALGPIQAVAAMAWGLDPVPSVDKIVGPGNPFFVEAKRQIFGEVGIDGLAGPTELVVIASEGADPRWIAADVLAQAEHGPDGLCLVFTDTESLAADVSEAVHDVLEGMAPARQADIRATLQSGGMGVCPNLETALALSEEIAPEHLALVGRAAEELRSRVQRAGAVFVGRWSPVAAGDYSAGTDHVLPTGGSARFASGLGPSDFVRRMAIFQGSETGVAAWGGAADTIARAEGFAAHALSVELRQQAAQGRSAEHHGLVPYVPPVPEGAVRLDLNENPYPWERERWERVLAGLQMAEPSRYPRRTAEVEAALARYAGVPADWCLVANGSDDLILAAVCSWGRRAARVLFPTPTFGMYRRVAQAVGVPAVGVPTLAPFSLPTSELLREVRAGGESIVILCRPNNPTGTLWSAEEVAELIEAEGVWAVVDEAYIEFATQSTGGREQGLASWLATHPRLVLLRTMSKAFGLAGLRVGYALGQPQTIAGWRQVVQPWAVSAFSAAAAMVALQQVDEMRPQIISLCHERERVTHALAQLPGICPFPSVTNFVLFAVDPSVSGWAAPELFERLYRDRIVIREWRDEPVLRDALRVSMGQPAENDRFLAALRDAIAERVQGGAG